jgi:hypothetical protein
LVQKSFLNSEAEREGVETAAVVVGFDDVYCYYSGHQIFDVSQVVNVEEWYGECDALVIVAVADVVVVETAEVGSEAEKSVEAVPADECKMDEPLVEEVVQFVEHIVEDSQPMADRGYMLVGLAAAAVAG